MPFTPLHMGPGLIIKALLQGSFSLMVFGWAQILMDIQPLFVIITGEGQLHGFSHTYLGATLLTLLAALSGKHLSEFGLIVLGIARKTQPIRITWGITFISAFIGTWSHVILDSIMHSDVQPFYPFWLSNELWGLLSIDALNKLCVYSGLAGAIVYYSVQHLSKGTLRQEQ
ncbi:MAG: metal-dependent hydrolase [Gammaproteobacteria bacterium]|nr:metal-dependent hydrolase [Gammaproteobacteria bacterium]